MRRAAAATDWSLDRSSEVPAYAQIEQRLSRMIGSGELPVGGRVPSERELAEMAGVSRLTARAALDSLARRGMLARGLGRRGTVVSSRKVTLPLTQLAGFTDMLGRDGVHAAARILHLDRLPAAEEVARELELGTGEEALRLRRLRLADGEPITLEDSWLPAARFPGLLERDVRGSLYQLMRDHYGIAPAHAVQRLEPVLAEHEQAALLQVAPGSPLMLVHRLARCAAGIPVEFALDRHRGDRARFVVEVSTGPPAVQTSPADAGSTARWAS